MTLTEQRKVAPTIPYEPHAEQMRLHASRARFRIVRAGRQSGKSRAAIAEESEWAMGKPRGVFWWVTASYRTKDRAWRGLSEHLPREIVKRKHESDLYFELGNGSRIWIKSADAPESLVSEGLDGLVCDEYAQWRPNVWQQHLQPMLAVAKAPAIFVGTPRGRNWAWELWRSVQADPEWSTHHWISLDSPYFPREEYERLKREMPERLFRQEILAEFLEDGGAVFRFVDECVGPLGRPDGYTVMGVDLAKARDYTAIHVLNSRRETVHRDRWNRLEWPLQRARIIELYRRLGCARVVVDATGVGDPMVDELLREGLSVEPVVLTSQSKAAIVETTMVAFEGKAIRIPDDEVLKDELKAFELEVLPSGRDRYSAPEGQHDDTVIALCLACWGVRHIPFGYSFPKKPMTREEREVQEVEELKRELVRRANNPYDTDDAWYS